MLTLPGICCRILGHLLYWFFFALEYICENSAWVSLILVCTAGFIFCTQYVFQVKVTVHPAASRTIKDIIDRFQAESMYSEDVDAVMVGTTLDADLTSDPVSKEVKRVRSSRRVAYAVRVALLAKAKVGLLANNRANELVYARICREAMQEHGVRPSHIAHQVPLAVAACFVPLDTDFLAASIRQHSDFKERRSLLGSLDPR
jgi:hypothetical protein